MQCGQGFWLCRSCFRGHRYCSELCRDAARALQLRKAGAKYRRSAEVKRDTWRDVNLEIDYHPTHTYNLGRMMQGMKDALEYCSEAFGPYQHRQARILPQHHPLLGGHRLHREGEGGRAG